MTTTDDLESGRAGARALYGFLALTAAIVAGLMALGFLPTRQLAGDGALAAMVAGCLISLVAAVAGTLPVILARGRPAADTVPSVMLSMAMRLGVVIVLGVAAAWSGWFEIGPLVVWLLVSHTALLVADVRFTKQILYSN